MQSHEKTCTLRLTVKLKGNKIKSQIFVATKDVFVATKIILVAAPTNDNREHGGMAVSINRPREIGVTVGCDF